MLNSNRVAPAALKFPAVIEVISDPDPNHGLRCRLYSSSDWREAWTWLPLDTTLYGPLLWGVATTLEIGRPSEDLLLVDLNQDVDLPLSNLLPEQLCPIPGLVRQTTRLIPSMADMTPAERDDLCEAWASPTRDAGVDVVTVRVYEVVATVRPDGPPPRRRQLYECGFVG